MKIYKHEYEELLSNPNLPEDLKQQVQKEAIPENWVFTGTDFSGQ